MGCAALTCVGMASTANERVVYLDDVLGDGFDEIEHRDGASEHLSAMRWRQLVDPQ
jgi:hypothetical protein